MRGQFADRKSIQDVFSPSVESSITRGSHMVPLLNTFSLTASCVGNHDLDFGFPHLSKLIEDCNFPCTWSEQREAA